MKISYSPRWRARGATGPYRVSPNLMAVVPTSTSVTLTYGASPAVSLGNLLSDLTALTGLVVAGFALRRRWRTRQ